MKSCIISSCTKNFYNKIIIFLENGQHSFVPLFLRICLAWEFFEAGYNKFHGQNWFMEVNFPFPFNLLPVELNWNLAMWFELIGGIALLLGFAIRFFSLSLMILTIVAMISIHFSSNWHSLSDILTGYRIIDENNDGMGNYKLPLIYLIMFLPLLSLGGGKFSIDYIVNKFICKKCQSTE